jgi:hypothetical protein
MPIEISNKILSRPETIVLHTLVKGYMNSIDKDSNRSKRNAGTAASLLNEIISQEGTPLLQELLDKAYPEQPNKNLAEEDKSEGFRADFLENFLYRLRSPRCHKAALLEAFLIAKRYIQDGDVQRFAQFNLSREINTIPAYVKTDFEIDEGIYFYEGNAENQTLLSSIIVSKQKKQPYYCIVQKRVYNQKDNESGQDFQDRMENGRSDEHFEFTGYIDFSPKNNLEFILLQKDDHRKRLNELNITCGQENESLIIKYSKDLVERTFINNKSNKNLTKRVRSNILKKQERYTRSYNAAPQLLILYNFSDLRRESNRAILNQFDKKLLDSAEQGDAIGMILALADGADINAQDPETGWTALHWTAKTGNDFCLTVLYDGPQEDLQDIFKKLEREGHDTIDIETKLSKSKQKLNPLILSFDNRFASEQSVAYRMTFDEVYGSGNKFLIQQREIHNTVQYLESDALQAKGLYRFLNNEFSVSMADRLRELGINDTNNTQEYDDDPSPV